MIIELFTQVGDTYVYKVLTDKNIFIEHYQRAGLECRFEDNCPLFFSKEKHWRNIGVYKDKFLCS